MKHPIAAVTTRPLLAGMIMVNGARSEFVVSSRIVLKVPRLSAKLRVQPNAIAMELIDKSSSGTRTDPGISSRRSILDKTTNRLVRKAKELCSC